MSRIEEIEQQDRLDRDYSEAWAAAPEEFRAAAEALGIGPETNRAKAREEGREFVPRDCDAAELADTVGAATSVDMAAHTDRLADQLREQFGLSPDQSLRVAAFIEDRVRQATTQSLSLQLSRVVGFFLLTGENLQARAHGLAHAARMASINGFPSLRSSARECGVSVEWVRRVAWKWCELLELPPLEGAKSEAAREAYREDKTNNHWRRRKFSAGPAPQSK